MLTLCYHPPPIPFRCLFSTEETKNQTKHKNHAKQRLLAEHSSSPAGWQGVDGIYYSVDGTTQETNTFCLPSAWRWLFSFTPLNTALNLPSTVWPLPIKGEAVPAWGHAAAVLFYTQGFGKTHRWVQPPCTGPSRASDGEQGGGIGPGSLLHLRQQHSHQIRTRGSTGSSLLHHRVLNSPRSMVLSLLIPQSQEEAADIL